MRGNATRGVEKQIAAGCATVDTNQYDWHWLACLMLGLGFAGGISLPGWYSDHGLQHFPNYDCHSVFLDYVHACSQCGTKRIHNTEVLLCQAF